MEKYQDGKDALFSLSLLSTVCKLDSGCLNLAFRFQAIFLFVAMEIAIFCKLKFAKVDVTSESGYYFRAI